MRTSTMLSLLAGLVLGMLLAPAGAQDRARALDPAAVHDAAKAAGLPVETVRVRDGRCEVVLSNTATPVQRVEAQAIEAAAARGDSTLTLSGARTLELRRAPALSLTDALAVLAVDPKDEAAMSVVTARVALVRGRGR